MAHKLRKQNLVDWKVQGSLAFRAGLYWMFCLITAFNMILSWRIVTGPARAFYTHFDDMWFHMAPALVVSIALMPLVVFDVVKLSNRFVGPVFRLRANMRALAQGESVAPLRYRKGDFWHEVAEEFNAVALRIAQLEANQRSQDGDDFEHQPLREEATGIV